jgi:hypothetical protein
MARQRRSPRLLARAHGLVEVLLVLAERRVGVVDVTEIHVDVTLWRNRSW